MQIEEMQQQQGWLTGRGGEDYGKPALLSATYKVKIRLHLQLAGSIAMPVCCSPAVRTSRSDCFLHAAFDKADLLYLRDTAEQQRHMEMEQRDTETAEFAAMRARIEREAELDARLPLNRASSLQKQGSGDKDKHK